MILSENDVKVGKILVYQIDVEVCGFLLEKFDKLQLYVDNIGSIDSNNRGMCSLSLYTKYIWHTHPHNLISYPSPEDIFKVIKKRKYPVISVIFTKWGIWYLQSDRKVSLDNKLLKYLDRKIQSISATIYHKTEKGRGKVEHKYINTFIKNIQELLYTKLNIKYKIQFESWEK